MNTTSAPNPPHQKEFTAYSDRLRKKEWPEHEGVNQDTLDRCRVDLLDHLRMCSKRPSFWTKVSDQEPNLLQQDWDNIKERYQLLFKTAGYSPEKSIEFIRNEIQIAQALLPKGKNPPTSYSMERC